MAKQGDIAAIMAEEELSPPNPTALSENESTKNVLTRSLSKTERALKAADESTKLNYYYTLVILHPNDIRKLLMLGD